MNFKSLFEGKLDDLIFIELDKLSKDSQLSEKLKAIPIRSNRFLHGVKSGTYSDNINFVDVIDGIIYTLGADPDFKYKSDYLSVLHLYSSELYPIFKKSLESAESNSDYEDIFIYTNGLIEIGEDEDILLFKRANALENIYNDRFNILTEEDKQEMLAFIISEYEKLTIPWSYYRLGYIYIGLERYVKGRLYFERFLSSSDDELLKEEVRQILDEVENFSNIEAAQTYIEYGDYNKALNSLYNVDNRYPHRDYLNYLLGFCENKVGNYLLAENHLEEALKSKETVREEYYNELAMIYVNLGDSERAIETYTKGIEEFINSYSLIYNRGVLLYNSNNFTSALNDFTRAYELDPNNDLLNIIENIKNNYIK